jgi:hypothetical protein
MWNPNSQASTDLGIIIMPDVCFLMNRISNVMLIPRIVTAKRENEKPSVLSSGEISKAIIKKSGDPVTFPLPRINKNKNKFTGLKVKSQRKRE